MYLDELDNGSSFKMIKFVLQACLESRMYVGLYISCIIERRLPSTDYVWLCQDAFCVAFADGVCRRQRQLF